MEIWDYSNTEHIMTIKSSIKSRENVDRVKYQDYGENWNVNNQAIDSSMVIKVELLI